MGSFLDKANRSFSTEDEEYGRVLIDTFINNKPFKIIL